MTFELPKQLQKPEFRFCLLSKSEKNNEKGQALGKAPIEINWQTTDNYFFDQINEAMQNNPDAAKNRAVPVPQLPAKK